MSTPTMTARTRNSARRPARRLAQHAVSQMTRQARNAYRPAQANRDDGSMLLAMMFMFVMTGLMILATATAIQGQRKTQDTRDFSAAHQASDQAFANALLYANLNLLPNTSATSITKSGTNGVTNWTWTITQTSDPTRWNVVVRAAGARVDREYRAVLNSNRILLARRIASTGDIDYIAENAEYFAYGFFATNGFTVTGAPDVDGYNGVDGLVTSNANLSLDTAYVDAVLLGNTRAAGTGAGRCTGAACATARRETKPHRIRLPAVPLAKCNASMAAANGNWRASSSGPLVAGRCYQSLDFNQDYNQVLDDPIYVWGNVSVNPNRRVNVAGNSTDPPARNMVIHIANGGTFSMQPGSQFAGGIFNPSGACTVNANASSTYDTRWLGAGTCRTIGLQNQARLRYDGAMRSLDADSATGQRVWYLSDYEIVD